MKTILTRVTLVLFLALFGVLARPQLLPAETPASLAIASEEFPPLSTSELTGFEDVLATEMYRRLGIETHIVHIPSQRVLVNANAGS